MHELSPPHRTVEQVEYRYEEHAIKTKLSHLLYMDDLKLIGKTEEDLQKQMQVVGTFSDDIHMLTSVQRLYSRKKH